MAVTKETWTVVENGKEVLVGYVPTYFPGVPNAGEARRVSVGIGQQVYGIDLSLIAGRTARVSGRAIDSAGGPFKDVSLSQEIRGLDFASFHGGPSAKVAGDGSFVIPDVPPGDYTLTAARMDIQGIPEVAQTDVVVDGTDVENVTLIGSAGGSVSGHVVAEEDGIDLPSVRITIGPVIRGQRSPTVLGAFRNVGIATVKQDGSFAVAHVFGRSRFQIDVPSRWRVKSVTHDGRDITDGDFELASAEKWEDIEIRVTKRSATIGGDIVDEQNRPVTSGTVILFALDSQRWFDGSRYVRASRPNQQGQWHVNGLPAGDYLAAAVDYVENGEWNDPEYLAGLRDLATKVSVADGGSGAARLKIVAPRQQ
ncbi:MAG TPA: carboxypeptidase-like regulatory domain-containing protein [Vicinamibacterales bacterium]